MKRFVEVGHLLGHLLLQRFKGCKKEVNTQKWMFFTMWNNVTYLIGKKIWPPQRVIVNWRFSLILGRKNNSCIYPCYPFWKCRYIRQSNCYFWLNTYRLISRKSVELLRRFRTSIKRETKEYYISFRLYQAVLHYRTPFLHEADKSTLVMNGSF